MTTALVNKIIPFSVVDGLGNRTSIFLQGCNIQCGYCHNPETQTVCIHCGDCIKGCPTGSLTMKENRVIWNRRTCIDCDQCIEVCTHNSSPKVVEMTAWEVFKEVEKALPFIRGITVSGGECTLYTSFLIELFKLAKNKGLSCLIDSNGTTDFSEEKELLCVCDGVMLDVKAWDEEVYLQLTGGKNEIVKKNLTLLTERGKLEEIRIVCLPDYVDAKEIIKQIARTLKPLLGADISKVKLKLITFRKFGVRGVFSEFDSPNKEYMNHLEAYGRELGFQNIIII